MKDRTKEIDEAAIVVTTHRPEEIVVAPEDRKRKKAGMFRRAVATAIDAGIAGLLLALPYVGEPVGLAYLLLRDGLDIKFLKGRSFGKTLMRLDVERTNGRKMDIPTSIKRNLPFAVGPAMALMPFLGLLFGPAIAVIIAAIEVWLVMTDPDGRRIGDKFGQTKVVNK